MYVFQSDVPPLYTQLQPTRALLADAMLQLVARHRWDYLCVIARDDYAADSFSKQLKASTVAAGLHVEYFADFALGDSDLTLHHKLRRSREKQCRIYILHTDSVLAEQIFDVLRRDNALNSDNVWLLSDAALAAPLHVYPAGALGFTLSVPHDINTIVEFTAEHVKHVLQHVQEVEPELMLQMPAEKSCQQVASRNAQAAASQLQRYVI